MAGGAGIIRRWRRTWVRNRCKPNSRLWWTPCAISLWGASVSFDIAVAVRADQCVDEQLGAGIAARFIARLEATPDPVRCIVHGDFWPPNVMMSDALEVTGLIDFSFTTRVGDHVMDLAGACHFLLATKSSSQADHDFVKQLILAKHGSEVMDLIDLYAVWFAFDFAFNHDDAVIFAWCTGLIRDFGQR